jgi:hypothetical protein
MLSSLVSLGISTGMASGTNAAPVQVVASVQGFSGAVRSDSWFTTHFDQHDGRGPLVICPDTGCGTGVGAADIDDVTPEEPALGRFDLGTSDLEFWNTDFGVEQTRNRIQFVSAPVTDVGLGEEFLLGWLTFTNGRWFSDPVFALNFVSSSSGPRSTASCGPDPYSSESPLTALRTRQHRTPTTYGSRTIPHSAAFARMSLASTRLATR